MSFYWGLDDTLEMKVPRAGDCTASWDGEFVPVSDCAGAEDAAPISSETAES